MCVCVSGDECQYILFVCEAVFLCVSLCLHLCVYMCVFVCVE